jgi:hypothetical protein
MLRSRLSRSAMLGALAFLTSGCVGITSGQVTWPSATANERRDFDQAMEYANRAKARYREAIGNQSKLVRVLGATLIPFGAAAGGLGATGGSSAAIVALLMAGGAGIAETTLLTSRPEQRAWAAGHNAIACAQAAVAPVRVIATDAGELTMPEQAVRDALKNLDDAIVPARRALESVRSSAGPSITTAADTALANALLTRQAANDVLTTTAQVRQQALAMPGLLVATVDKIGGLIMGAVIEQGPDAQALARLVGGLAQGYGQFIQVPSKGAKAGETPPAAQGKGRNREEEALRKTFDDAFAVLELRRLDLDRAARALADRVNAVGTKPLADLQACGVNTEKLAAPFTVEPPGPVRLSAGKAGSARFVIRGGAAPFAVNLEGTNLDGLTVQHRDPMSAAFLLLATDKITATAAAIHVADRAGNDQFVELEVAAADSSKSGGAGQGDGGADRVKVLDEARKKLVVSPAPKKTFGGNAVTITNASVDAAAKILKVDVQVASAAGVALPRADAAQAVTAAKDTINDWIAGIAGDDSIKDSITVSVTNP